MRKHRTVGLAGPELLIPGPLNNINGIIMSMEHKAYLFDTEKFYAEIKPVMEDSVNNPEEMLYEADPEDWMEAYDELCGLYEDVLSQKKGLLFTF